MAVSFDRLHPVEPSPEARRLLWHVLLVGVVTRDEPERREAHDKPGAFLFWVSSGKGKLEVGERSFDLRPGPRCWLLDFSSEYEVSHFFRRATGISPSQFRLMARTQQV